MGPLLILLCIVFANASETSTTLKAADDVRRQACDVRSMAISRAVIDYIMKDARQRSDPRAICHASQVVGHVPAVDDIYGCDCYNSYGNPVDKFFNAWRGPFKHALEESALGYEYKGYEREYAQFEPTWWQRNIQGMLTCYSAHPSKIFVTICWDMATPADTVPYANATIVYTAKHAKRDSLEAKEKWDEPVTREIGGLAEHIRHALKETNGKVRCVTRSIEILEPLQRVWLEKDVRGAGYTFKWTGGTTINIGVDGGMHMLDEYNVCW